MRCLPELLAPSLNFVARVANPPAFADVSDERSLEMPACDSVRPIVRARQKA